MGGVRRNTTRMYVCIWVCVRVYVCMCSRRQALSWLDILWAAAFIYLYEWRKEAGAMQHCCQQQHQHVAFMKSFYLLGLMLANINGHGAWQGYHKKLFLAAILSDMVTCQLSSLTACVRGRERERKREAMQCCNSSKQGCHLECH